MRHCVRQQSRLDGQVLRHGLNHPVAAGQLRQIVLEVAGGNQRRERGLIESSRFGLGQLVESGFSEPVSIPIASRNHIQKQNRNPGIGQVSRDAGAHGSRAQHCGAAYQKRPSAQIENGSGNRGVSAHWESPCAASKLDSCATRKRSKHTERRTPRSRTKQTAPRGKKAHPAK